MIILKGLSRLIGKNSGPVPVPNRGDNVLTQEIYNRFMLDIWEGTKKRYGFQSQKVYWNLVEVPWSESNERLKRHKELLDKWPRLYGTDKPDTASLHMSDERCLDCLNGLYAEIYPDQLSRTSVKVME